MSHGVKVVHSSGVCRRFLVDDFQDLKRGIRDLVGIDPCSVTLCYVDTDGDMVEMETANEFVAAVAQAGATPLTIRLSARALRPTRVPAAPLCTDASLHLSAVAGAPDAVHVLRAPRSTPYVPGGGGGGGAATTATATVDAFVPRRVGAARRRTGHRDPCAPAVVAPTLRVEVLAECLATADKGSPHGDLVLQVVLQAGSEAGLLRASCAVREGGGDDGPHVSSLRLAVSVEDAAAAGGLLRRSKSPSVSGGVDDTSTQRSDDGGGGGGGGTTATTGRGCSSGSSDSSSSSGSSSGSRPARRRLTRRVLRRHRRAAARPAAAAAAEAADSNNNSKKKKKKKREEGGTLTSTSGDGSGTLTSSSSTTSVDDSSTASTYSTSSPSGTTSGSQTSLTTAASSATQQRRARRGRRNRHREPEAAAAAAAAAAASLPLAVPLASVELVMGQVVDGPYNMHGIALQGGSPRLGVPVSV